MQIDNDTTVKAIIPNVLSISRVTDIPAFHLDWLEEVWAKGYCEWINPFGGKSQFVAFQNVKAIVFWSKNPSHKIFPFLDKLDRRKIKYYFQFTLNDYADTGLEPGVPDLEVRLETFVRLARRCPVIWRYDPAVFSDDLTVKEHMRRIKNIMEKLAPHTKKLVFSYIDLAIVTLKNALKKLNGGLHAPDDDLMRYFAEEVVKARDQIAPWLKLASCGEKIDLSEFGIEHNHCVDSDLLEEICAEKNPAPDASKERAEQLSLLENTGGNQKKPRRLLFDHKKDSGQRPFCGCHPSKDIGSHKMKCPHGCRYCYANHGGKYIEKAVSENR